MLSRVCFLLTLSHTIPSLASALQAACRSLCLAVPLLGGVQRCSVAMARLLLACWMQSEVVAAPPSHAATRRGTGALQPGGSGHLMPPSVSPTCDFVLTSVKFVVAVAKRKLSPLPFCTDIRF